MVLDRRTRVDMDKPTTRRRRARTTRAAALVAAMVVAALAILPVTVEARANSTRDREISMARQSLALGNTDEAIRIYERLLDSDPEDEGAFWGLAEVYTTSGADRDELIPLLDDWIARHPEDFRARRALGGAYARLGEFDRAHGIWIDALRRGKPDPARYSDIGELELANKMLEQAVQTFLDGRQVLGRPDLFAEDMVRAYAELGDYDNAIDECVTVVAQHSGVVQWAVNRVEMMLDGGAPRRDIERKMDALARSETATPSVMSYVGSVYMVLDRPKRALSAFLKADGIMPNDGQKLLESAAILDDAGYIDEARDAYRMVQERHPDTASAASAGVELGRGLARDGKLDDALKVLRETGERYKQLSEGGEALLTAAELQLRMLHSPGDALKTIDGLLDEQRSRGKRLEEEAKLTRIDALMALGRFEDAHSAATDLLTRRLNESLEQKAVYALGFSSFLAGERRRALDELRSMIKADPSGSLVNDALRIMLVIAEAEESSNAAPATALAAGYYAQLRGDYGEASNKLDEVLRIDGGGAAATEALLLLGAIEQQNGDYDAALSTYARASDETSSMSAQAEALMRSGDILADSLGRPDDAVEKYTRILEDLPTNALTGEARRKIDAIRKGRSLEG